MKTALTFLAILFLSFSMSASVYGNGAWLDGQITNPSGTNYYGGPGNHNLPQEAFGVGDAHSYIQPSTGQTGLYAGSAAANLGGTYVKVSSHYHDGFTFFPDYGGIATPVHINFSFGMSYQFISPSDTYPGFPIGGQAGLRVIFNAGGYPTKTVEFIESADHTTGNWNTPPGSFLFSGDLGYYLNHFCGRSTDTFLYGDTVSLDIEFFTWARNGAIVNSLYTGEMKFLLPDELKADGAYLTVTSTSGYRQTDGVAPIPPTIFLFGSSLLGLIGWRRFRKF